MRGVHSGSPKSREIRSNLTCWSALGIFLPPDPVLLPGAGPKPPGPNSRPCPLDDDASDPGGLCWCTARSLQTINQDRGGISHGVSRHCDYTLHHRHKPPRLSKMVKSQPEMSDHHGNRQGRVAQSLASAFYLEEESCVGTRDGPR